MSTRHSPRILAGVLAALLAPATAGAQWLLTDGLAGASGSTVGPDGALYVTEGLAGQVTRVDPWTGDTSAFGTNLPQGGELIPGLGGPADMAFIDGVAYVLVTLVNGCFGGPNEMGIYEMKAPDNFEVLADLGRFNNDNPPATPFDLGSAVRCMPWRKASGVRRAKPRPCAANSRAHRPNRTAA